MRSISALLRPDVAEVDGLAVAALAERFGRQVDVHPAGERVGNYQRRRRQVVGADLRMDAALEIAVPRQHRRHDHVVLGNGVGDFFGQRTAVADASRATVTDQVETECVEIGLKAGLGEIVGDDFRTWSEARLDPRLALQPTRKCVARDEPRRNHHGRI